MEEIWKEVKTNKTTFISNKGNIKSEKSIRVFDFTGYMAVRLMNKTYYIHRLVAEAFVPNPQNKPCVNHKDGNKHNNNESNLEWVTYSENNKHAYRIGLKKPTTKTSKHKSVCMLNDENEIICVFLKMNYIDKLFNKKVSGNIIRAIKNKQKCMGYKWEYYYDNDINLKIK